LTWFHVTDYVISGLRNCQDRAISIRNFVNLLNSSLPVDYLGICTWNST
jgi:hypothetical protein